MKITMNRAELLSAAQRAAVIAPEDSPVEVLRGTLLEINAAAGKLILTATNLETMLEQRLDCAAYGAPAKAPSSFRGERKGKETQQGMPEGHPERSGLCPDDDSLVVDAKLLAGMLERLPGDMVELVRRPGTPVLSLRSGQAGYDVAIWERGSFPKLEIPFPEDTVKVSGIPSMARRTMFATSEDKDKPLMRCVNLMFTREGLKGAGYNGRCLVTAKGDDKSTGNISLLLPASSLERLAALCTDDDEFLVGIAGGYLVFMRQGLMFGAQLMEGDYMDTDRLMNNIRNQFTVLTDVADLRRALKVVAAVAPKGRVKLAFDRGRITFSCQGKLGSASQCLETAPLTGVPRGEYWYQIPDLMACLRSLSGTATLGIAQAGMLDLSTEGAYYMQTAMREPAPVAAPVVVKEAPKAEPKKAVKKAKSTKAPKPKTAKKAA